MNGTKLFRTMFYGNFRLFNQPNILYIVSIIPNPPNFGSSLKYISHMNTFENVNIRQYYSYKLVHNMNSVY